MGCDGGIQAKRHEMVKSKTKTIQDVDPKQIIQLRMNCCTLSQQNLKAPVVCCYLGNLYNKEALLTYLLQLKSSPQSVTVKGAYAHIKSLKDVFTVQPHFTATNSASSSSSSSTSSSSSSSSVPSSISSYSCPLSGLPASGHHRFFALRSCGCILSEKALKEFSNSKSSSSTSASASASASASSASSSTSSSSSAVCPNCSHSLRWSFIPSQFLSCSSLLEFVPICPSDSEREILRKAWPDINNLLQPAKKQKSSKQEEKVKKQNENENENGNTSQKENETEDGDKMTGIQNGKIKTRVEENGGKGLKRAVDLDSKSGNVQNDENIKRARHSVAAALSASPSANTDTNSTSLSISSSSSFSFSKANANTAIKSTINSALESASQSAVFRSLFHKSDEVRQPSTISTAI